MKIDAMYESIVKMTRAYGEVDKQPELAEQVIADPVGASRCFISALPFYGDAAQLLSAVLADMDRKSGAGMVSAVRRIAEYGAKHNRIKGMFKDDGRFCVCDGYRLVRLFADLPSIPHHESDISPLNTAAVMPDTLPDESAALPIPDTAELRAFIATAKAEGKAKKAIGMKPYKWESVSVNPEFLLTILQSLPGCKAFKTGNKLTAPIYFTADNGDGILMPVKPEPTPEEKAFQQHQREQWEREWREREAQERTQCEERNAETEKTISAAVETLRNGGDVKNVVCRLYDDRLSHFYYSDKHLFLLLFQRYGIDVPPRTKKWIADKLTRVSANVGGNSKSDEIWFVPSRKGERASNSFMQALIRLKEAVKAT